MRRVGNSRLFYSVVFFTTMLPAFWDVELGSTPVRFLIWWAAPLLWMGNVATGRK